MAAGIARSRQQAASRSRGHGEADVTSTIASSKRISGHGVAAQAAQRRQIAHGLGRRRATGTDKAAAAAESFVGLHRYCRCRRCTAGAPRVHILGALGRVHDDSSSLLQATSRLIRYETGCSDAPCLHAIMRCSSCRTLSASFVHRARPAPPQAPFAGASRRCLATVKPITESEGSETTRRTLNSMRRHFSNYHV